MVRGAVRRPAQCARYTDSLGLPPTLRDDTDMRIESTWNNSDTARRTALPEVVMWPPEGADVVPAFFIEQPDPLPDFEVSGFRCRSSSTRRGEVTS